MLALSGELDLLSAPVLKEAIRQAQEEEPGLLVLDLGELTFMDSSGLAVIVAAKEHADARGDGLVLRRAAAQVRRLLQLSGLSGHLIVEE